MTPAYRPGNCSLAVTAADVDLTVPADADKARCGYLTTAGTLTANRNVIVPNSWQADQQVLNTAREAWFNRQA